MTFRYYLTGPSTKAEGSRVQDQFVVFKGSAARTETVQSMPPTYQALREKLVGDGLLIDAGESLTLGEDYVFSSPSAAAAVFLGRSANGLDEWRDAHGTTLKQLDSLAAITPSPAEVPSAAHAA